MFVPLGRTYPSQFNQRGGEGTYTYLTGSATISIDLTCEEGRFPLFLKGAATLSVSSAGLLRPTFTHLQRTPLATLDPYLDQVVLLLSNTDDDQNGVIRDRSLSGNILSPHIWRGITRSYPEYNTSIYKFPPSSLYCSDDVLELEDSDDFAFGTGNFTIDFQFRHDGTGFGWIFSSSSRDYVRFSIQVVSRKIIVRQNESVLLETPSNSYIYDVWTHAAIIRNGNTLKIFIDEVETASVDVTGLTIGNREGNKLFGYWRNYEVVPGVLDVTYYTCTCYIQDFRITKGTARTPDKDTQAISPTEGKICLSSHGRLSNPEYITPVDLSLTIYAPAVGVLKTVTPATFIFTPIHPSIKLNVKKLHTVNYCSIIQRIHQIAYNLGDLPSRFHSITWATEARRLHSILYESVSATLTQDQRFHTISYSVTGTDPLVSANRYHAILYEGSGISPLISDQRLHEISYEVIGADSLTAATRYHETFYEGSGINPLVADQRLHEISYAVVGIDPVTSSTRYHEILYTVGTDPLTVSTRYHEVLYEGSGISPLVSDQRLHTIYYSIVLPESVQRLHEISYSVDTTIPVSSASAFHQVSYGVFASQYALHEIFYKSIVLDQRLHTAGWKTDTEQRRLHEVVYRSININPIIEAGLITVGDGGLNTYDFLGITITADEESPYWQCEMVLKDSADYVRFPRDTAYIVRMFGVDFHFIVDSRSLQRSIDDQGSYQETCTITGLSPLALKARPRATRLTKTWETPILASAVVTELLGANTWALVDWLIPAYRLACERADPLAVAKQVVEAVGGLIESQPDGSLVCRHRWPVSIAALDSVAADQTLDERVIYSASEAPTQDELVDRVRIYDTEPGFQDRLEYVPNAIGESEDPRNGILYAFPSPWRENLRIVTTRPSVISVGNSTTGTRTIADSNADYPAETITFTERTSSTQYPILSLTSLDWLDEDLGAAVYTPYATTMEASNGSYGGYSLAKVEYTTRYLAVPVNCASPLTEEIEAQFLLLEDS